MTGSSAGIRNNSYFQTVAGLGGDGSPQGQPGSAVGLKLIGAGEVIAANNALVQHGTGISSTVPTAHLLEHNDLWENKTDYEGMTPGAGNLHVAPAFVDPGNGDLHLRADSALIDAGTNSGIPPQDTDGEPRPLDGDGDGIAIADIGADEYWPGLHGSKAVGKLAATAGDVLTYRLTLANPSIPCELPGVSFTDTIPSHTTYIPGPLSGSSGAWGYARGVINWTGAVSTAVPVTLTFQVVVDEVAGPLAIVNRAVLDDSVGAPRALQAVTLIDPVALLSSRCAGQAPARWPANRRAPGRRGRRVGPPGAGRAGAR